ncbi:MAG TPA: response regulator transcription factor, partial [Chloroflexota bacterium]|nr:response regulator transcription factor [Chloroflexota bacterium]
MVGGSGRQDESGEWTKTGLPDSGAGPRTVLVVDDDPDIVALMRDFLDSEGFSVAEAGNPAQAEARLQRDPIDCVLLDVMLPGDSGFELCRRIRETSDIPILFLSARQEDVDKLRGLGLGADDYIVKSATPTEVVARIRAVLRRTGGRRDIKPTLRYAGLSIDVGAREVYVDGRLVNLTPKEYDLLWLMAAHPRQVFTHEALIARLWGDIGDRHAVTVHVGRLRDKIEPDPAHPK